MLLNAVLLSGANFVLIQRNSSSESVPVKPAALCPARCYTTIMTVLVLLQFAPDMMKCLLW